MGFDDWNMESTINFVIDFNSSLFGSRSSGPTDYEFKSIFLKLPVFMEYFYIKLWYDIYDKSALAWILP